MTLTWDLEKKHSAQVVKAPGQTAAGKSSGKVIRGGDLRDGQKAPAKKDK